MKTTQMTSKFLVAALLLSVVSPVLAVEMPEAVKNAWTKTKAFGTTAWNKTKSASTTAWNTTKTTVLPKKYAEGQKEAELAALRKVAEIAELNTQIEAATKLETTDDAGLATKNETIAKLTAQRDAAQNSTTGLRFKFNELNINHPNYVKYGAMSAIATAIITAGTLAYKYSLPKKAVELSKKAFNKVKSFLGFNKQALDPIIAQAEKLANEKTAGLLSVLETPAIKAAFESLKTTKAELLNAIKEFDANVKTAADVALSGVKVAVDAANAELATQEQVKQAAAKAKLNTPAPKKEEAKKPATTTPERKATSHSKLS